MSYSLVIQSEAIIDIQDAFEWYEEQNSAWGSILLKKLKMVTIKFVIIQSTILQLIHISEDSKLIVFPTLLFTRSKQILLLL